MKISRVILMDHSCRKTFNNPKITFNKPFKILHQTPTLANVVANLMTPKNPRLLRPLVEPSVAESQLLNWNFQARLQRKILRTYPPLTMKRGLTMSQMNSVEKEIKGKLTSSYVIHSDYRLIQNRKSAMKCRLKKKAEFDKLKKDFSALKESSLLLN